MKPFNKILALWFFTFFSLVTPRFAHAQFSDESPDAFDPFSDYSEFDEATEEEADINFFRNGRFFSLSLMGGYRSFTQILGEIYKPSGAFGGGLTYFFDLRFAIQVVYLTGDHPFLLETGGVRQTGTTSLQTTSFDVKYFLNTQNVTKGLAKVNPYLLVGIAQVYRTNRLDSSTDVYKDAAVGFEGGFGIEFPLMKNKMFLGIEGTYQYINFPDENNELLGSGVYPRGDVMRGLGILGINF